jgi:hypothetical protein
MNYYVAFKNLSSISSTLEENFFFQCLLEKRRGHLALYGEKYAMLQKTENSL